MQSLRTFLRDDRAVAPVVGFVLLFGIGVIAFSGYQAVQVPQQNAETEFQHYENVQNDLIVVRNAISRAGQQNQSQFESVRLGTQYRERALALNPPDSVGALRTSERYNITLDNGTDEGSINVTTRFLEYQNGYNELEIEPIYYENSVLYLDAESGQRVFFEDQNLVRDRDNGSTVVITALQREFSQSATGRVTLELYPTDGGTSLPDGELNVTLPTRLPEDYWREELDDGDADETDTVRNFSYNSRAGTVNQVLFNVTSEELEFNTVGINNEPDQTGSVSDTGENNNNINNTEGDPLPDDAVAFDDANGNGVYDADGDEETYSSNEVKGFNDDSVDLVIEKDVVENGNWGITANTVTVRSGVTVESTNNGLTITTNGGDLTAAGATLRAGKGLALNTGGSGDIDLENATISGGGLKASPGDGQIVFIDGARIEDTEGEEGELKVTSGSISGTPAYGEVD
jgi:hypothetical protein